MCIFGVEGNFEGREASNKPEAERTVDFDSTALPAMRELMSDRQNGEQGMTFYRSYIAGLGVTLGVISALLLAGTLLAIPVMLFSFLAAAVDSTTIYPPGISIEATPDSPYPYPSTYPDSSGYAPAEASEGYYPSEIQLPSYNSAPQPDIPSPATEPYPSVPTLENELPAAISELEGGDEVGEPIPEGADASEGELEPPVLETVPASESGAPATSEFLRPNESDAGDSDVGQDPPESIVNGSRSDDG